MKKFLNNFEISVLVVSFFCIIAILVMIVFIIIRNNANLKYQNLDVVFDNSDIISIENKLPIADSIGKEYEGSGMEEGIEEYSTFSITNPNDKKITYEIYMTEQSPKTNYIRSNYIKLYLTDENNIPYKGFDKNRIPSFYDFYVLNDKPGSKLLYRSTLMANKTAKFKLRMWLADSYVINQNKEDFGIDIDVRIE